MPHELDQTPLADLRSTEAQREIAVMDAAEHAGPLATAHAYETEATPSWAHRIAVGATTLAAAFGTTEAAKADTTRAQTSSAEAAFNPEFNVFEPLYKLRAAYKESVDARNAQGAGLEYTGIDDHTLAQNVEVVSHEPFDDIKKITFNKSGRVSVTSRPTRHSIFLGGAWAGKERDPERLNLEQFNVEVAPRAIGEMATTVGFEKNVAPKGKNPKLVKIGKPVPLEDKFDYSEENMVRLEGHKDPAYTSTARLKMPKRLKELARQGKLYLNVRHKMTPRQPGVVASSGASYPSSYGIKTESAGFSAKVHFNKRGTMRLKPTPDNTINDVPGR